MMLSPKIVPSYLKMPLDSGTQSASNLQADPNIALKLTLDSSYATKSVSHSVDICIDETNVDETAPISQPKMLPARRLRSVTFKLKKIELLLTVHLTVRPPLFCSCRLILSAVSCIGFVNLYILRYNLTIAMHWMVNETAVHMLTIPMNETAMLPAPECDDIFPVFNRTELGIKYTARRKAPHEHGGNLVWSKDVQSITNDAFDWGYLITQVPGGWLSERYGGKIFFGGSVFISSMACLIIPVAARADYMIVVALRIITGICQGVSWPAMFVIWARWATPKEKQKLTSLTFAGSIFGIVIILPAVSVICDDGGLGWSYVFYFSGGVGVLWTVAWYVFVFDSPMTHPRIDKVEKIYIHHFLKGTITKSLKKPQPATPWMSLLTSRPALGLIGVHICLFFVITNSITLLPRFMTMTLGYDDTEAGLFQSVPFIGFALITVFSAFLFDSVTSRHLLDMTVVRKIGNSIGTVIPAVCIFTASFIDCDRKYVAIGLINAGITMCGFMYGAGFLNNYTELAPQHVGVFFGISNTAAIICSNTARFYVNNQIKHNLLSEWSVLFIIISEVLLLNCLLFCIFGSTEVQTWALPAPDDSELSIRRKASDDQRSSVKRKVTDDTL